MYSIQYYAINYVSDLRQVDGFLRFHPPTKLTAMIAEILLKVTLNTITLTPLKMNINRNPQPVFFGIIANGIKVIAWGRHEG